MAKNLDFNAMAASIIELVGGVENLSNVNHCATRLRLTVKDPTQVDKAALEKIRGVIAVADHNNEFQIIVGQVIEDLYQATTKQVGSLATGAVDDAVPLKDKKPLELFGEFLMMMAGIMSPVIAPLIAAGFITVTLLVMNMFFGVSTDNSTYVILNNLAQTVFYFLPVFVAYTSAQKFHTEPVMAMVLAAWLLYPDWVSMASEGGFTSYFGIPTLLTTYNGAVIQIIVATWIMAHLDSFLKRVLPESVRHFLKPFLLLVIMSVITLPLIAPLGGLLTNYIGAGMNFLRDHAPFLMVPAFIIFANTVGLVLPGFHLALVPIALTSIAELGYDDFLNIAFYACTITPGFIALAVGLKTKSGTLKQIAFPAAISALFGGISEPTVYGINYKMPKIFACSVATSIVTGIYAGIVGLKCYGFGGYSITNILLYLGPNGDQHNFTMALIGVVIMAVMAFVTVFMTNWDDSVYEDDEDAEPAFKLDA